MMKIKENKKVVGDLVSKLIQNDQKAYRHESYSQCGEDLIIDFIFNTIGISHPTYIDIGAHHPFRFNNTAIFYNKGCKGINVEPDPYLYNEFKRIRKRDTNLNIGVGGNNSILEFHKMSVPALNTFSSEEALRLQEKFGYAVLEKMQINVETIKEIISKYHQNVFPDFLSLDVEGMDDEIIRSIDFDNKYPSVICTETLTFENDGTGKKNLEIIDYLKSKDYMVYADTYINTIVVKKDKWLNR